MECFTCKITTAVDKSYPVREAVFGESSGRCRWHAWDNDAVFVCSVCRKPKFSEQVAWCRKKDVLICTECVPSQTVENQFWFWKKYTLISCPHCGERHPTLNRQEFLGEHPWQANPFRCPQFPIWYPGGRLLEKKNLAQRKPGIRCPHCNARLSVSDPGTYQCPYCHQTFQVRKKSHR